MTTTSSSGTGESTTHEFDGIDLGEAIQSIRDQLIDAAGRATDKPLLFNVGDIQMEFTVELRRETRGGTKVRAWVVEAGADAARTTGLTHKVAFTLTPKDPRTNARIKVGNPDPGDTSAFGRPDLHTGGDRS